MTILKSSAWRSKFRVHPAADIFPMMSDEELDELGADIQAHGLNYPIGARLILHAGADAETEVFDGRNRLEALERAGIAIKPHHVVHHDLTDAEVVAHIISANIRRRHLTPGQMADIIVALAKIEIKKETGSSEPVSEMPDIPPELDRRGGRGKKNPVKEKALELNAALPEDQRASESSIKRAIAKAEGPPKAKAEPKPRETCRAPLRRRPRLETQHVGVIKARRLHVGEAVNVGVDVEGEIELFADELRRAARKRAGNGAAGAKERRTA